MLSGIIPPERPRGYAEILAHFGDPKVQKGANGWIVDAKWESDNCITVHHALLPLGKLYCHKLVAAPLLRLLDRWATRIAAGDTHAVKTLGCFSPRAQRGSMGLIASTHTWAIAFDLNADDNPLILRIAPDDMRRQTAKLIPDAWIADAKAEGWFWGGEFHDRFDPQHFQFCDGY